MRKTLWKICPSVAARLATGEWRTPFFLGLLFLAGLGLRVVHLATVSGLPWFAADQPVLDAYLYDRVAWNIVCGDPWRTPEITYATSPTYAIWLAGLYRVFGHDVLVPRIVQALLGATVPLMLFHLGRKTIGTVAGWSAALLAAFYGLLIFYDGEMLKASLSLFLLVASLCWIVPLGEGRGHPLLAGLTLALAVGMPGNVVPIVLVVLAWVVCRERRRWRFVVLFVAGMAIPLVPYHLRHLWTPPDRTPFAYPAGIHLYIGNGPMANGTYAPVFGIAPSGVGHVLDAAKLKEKETGRRASPREVSAWWTSRTLAAIRSDPSRFGRLALRKLRLFANAYEIPNNEDYYFARRYSWVLRLPLVSWAIVAPLAFLGLCLAVARLRPAGALLYSALFIVVVLTLVLSFVTARYRLPAVPFACLLAGHAIQWTVEAVKARRWCWIGFSVGPLVVGVALVLWPTPLDPARYLAGTEKKMRRYYPRAFESTSATDANMGPAAPTPPGGRRAEDGCAKPN